MPSGKIKLISPDASAVVISIGSKFVLHVICRQNPARGAGGFASEVCSHWKVFFKEISLTSLLLIASAGALVAGGNLLPWGGWDLGS